MNVNISFTTDNAAFEDSFLMAVTQVLSQAKGVIIDSENVTPTRRPLRDFNGNRIGVVEMSSN